MGPHMRAVILALGCLATAFSLPALANGQQQLTDAKLASDMLWRDVYPIGGTTLFCAQPFSGPSSQFTAIQLYSDKQLKRALRCITDRQCSIMNPDFPYMAADLHNLYPALTRVKQELGKATFGELDDNLPSRFADIGCELKIGFKQAEPRNEAKGDVARAIFYMHSEYGLPIVGSLPMLKKWHQMDPPDAEDKARNDRIEALQGNRNTFIDNPALAEQLGGN